MKAVLCKAYGLPESLVVEEVAPLVPKPGQVVIAVRACGVNFPDTLIIQGKYQFKPEMPFSPGGEVAGIVAALGDGIDNVAVGDAVIAFTGWGGFAEEVCTDAARLIPMPPGAPFELAASFVMTYGTSYHALKDRANLQPGETLAVLGAAGGVGLAAVEIGKALRARVIACASSDEKLAVCKQHGADEVINYSRENLKDRLKALTGGKGIDVAYDPVGGEYAEPVIRSMAWQGRYLVVGFAAGDIPKIPLNLVLLKGSSLVGVFWGSFAAQDANKNRQNLAELTAMLMQGRLKPLIFATYPLERAADALNDVMQRRVMGKAVLATSGLLRK